MIIDSFKVIIIRGDKVVYHKLLHDEHRAKFDDETKNMFKRLRSKDRLIMENEHACNHWILLLDQMLRKKSIDCTS
jgi:hypothetical protein